MDGMEQLSTEECWTLLREHVLGRVAFTERAMPTIVPISYSLVGDKVHLRCGSERLAELLDHQVVAFEVDDTVARRAACSSVVVTGTATRAVAGAAGDGAADRTTVVVQDARVRGRRMASAA